MSATLQTTQAVVTGTAGPQRRVKRKTWKTIIWLIAMIVLAAVILYPLLWLTLATLKPSSEFGTNPGLIPEQPTWQNFVRVSEGIAGVPMWRFFWNTIVLSVVATAATVISHALAAYAFARIRFKGSKILFTCMIATLLLPFHVVIIPQYIIFNNLNLIDTYIPILIGKFLATEAFFVFLIMQFIRSVPRELDEAARIDGAGHARIFFSIMLPLIVPTLTTVAIFTFLGQWNDFFGPLLYLTSPENYPLSMALKMYNDQTSVSDYGATTAASFIALVPVLLFFVIFQRFIITGMSSGAVKG
ncbi:sugar ABC transporter permease [Microbacterium nanhaiense]|uniref:Sugar ABC transporter permease n=1 Tax=Microbacterium nanhaiense TaxID=1301026 RepID=A0ABQ2N1E9_9MICO|nr:carbohydrate ABC transporter permease [Microbacterium nanhaiense]GGO64924.1 sugar ABC transporter permease [Microbacterium nanhaiense]